MKFSTPIYTWLMMAGPITLFVTVLFTLAGAAKLTSSPGVIEEFRQIGFGQWLRYLTGILEVSGAIGLLIPTLRFWAALLIATVMAGATATNLFILHIPALAGLTAVLMALLLTLAWQWRPAGHPQTH
jgi:putative oxidoreductase